MKWIINFFFKKRGIKGNQGHIVQKFLLKKYILR